MWMRSLVMSRQNQRGRSPVVTWALGSTVYETSGMATRVWDAILFLTKGLIDHMSLP